MTAKGPTSKVLSDPERSTQGHFNSLYLRREIVLILWHLLLLNTHRKSHVMSPTAALDLSLNCRKKVNLKVIHISNLISFSWYEVHVTLGHIKVFCGHFMYYWKIDLYLRSHCSQTILMGTLLVLHMSRSFALFKVHLSNDIITCRWKHDQTLCTLALMTLLADSQELLLIFVIQNVCYLFINLLI